MAVPLLSDAGPAGSGDAPEAASVLHRWRQTGSTGCVALGAAASQINHTAGFVEQTMLGLGHRFAALAAQATAQSSRVETLLRKAVTIDSTLADAHVQLGNLYADQRQYDKSIPEYTRALELDPNLADAHYRLGQDYVHTGQKERAQSEFDVYQRLRAQHLADLDKERAEVQQFVYSAKAASSGKQ